MREIYTWIARIYGINRIIDGNRINEIFGIKAALIMATQQIL